KFCGKTTSTLNGEVCREPEKERAAMLRLRHTMRINDRRISNARLIVVGFLVVAPILLATSKVVGARQSTADSKLGNSSRQQIQERNHPAPSTQTIYAPLGMEESNQAEIVLNNNSPGNMDVTAAFYNDGGKIAGRTVALKPA